MKNEILPFASVWMYLETIMLSEVSQMEEDKYSCYHLYVEIKKIKHTNVYNKKETESRI